MKRLSGGLVLLNLTAISLALTSGEVDITDAGILEELTELRQFIDVNRDFSKGFKNLKPIMIEYRSSASKFNGITQANLSFNTDALHMSIGANTIQADGKLLVITINVVYEYTDYVGYTIKSAKLNAYETLADGDATFTGDVGVGGDLEVTGNAVLPQINGESNPSVKPLYWHGLEVWGSGINFTMVIINNSDASISKSTFKSIIESIGDGALYNVNGVFSDDTFTPDFIYAIYNGGALGVEVIGALNGGRTSKTYATLDDFIDLIDTITDRHNKLN